MKVRSAECEVRNKIIQITFIILIGLVSGAYAVEPSIVFSPKKVGPGDIMTVTVKNAAGTVEGSFNGKHLYFNPAKKAFKAVVGIDLKTDPGTYPLALTVGGRSLTRDVVISKKKYPVQKLTLPEDMVVLSPENEARTDREQRKMAAIWPVDSLRVWQGSFVDPLPGKALGTPFGVRRIINNIPKNPHSGVDITADEGGPVKAPNDGVVILVDDQFYSGNSIVLDHGQGIYTMFFHLSTIKVKYGQAVRKGDVIAFVGSTGRSTGAHLHWGVRVQGAKVDPLALIKLKLD
jgi:murein DD-endopeptidase MepM/ murein hydrolase activator NlpD